MATNDEVIAKIDELIAQRDADQQAASQHPIVGLVVGIWDYLVARVGPVAAAVVVAIVGFHYTVMAVLDRPDVQAHIKAATEREQSFKLERDAQAEKTRLEIAKLQGP